VKTTAASFTPLQPHLLKKGMSSKVEEAAGAQLEGTEVTKLRRCRRRGLADGEQFFTFTPGTSNVLLRSSNGVFSSLLFINGESVKQGPEGIDCTRGSVHHHWHIYRYSHPRLTSFRCLGLQGHLSTRTSGRELELTSHTSVNFGEIGSIAR
jgi:hypothetical protein